MFKGKKSPDHEIILVGDYIENTTVSVMLVEIVQKERIR